MLAEPIHEIPHFDIAPHPAWKTSKGLPLRGASLAIAHIIVDAFGVRPVRFHGDDIEPVAFHQSSCDRRASPVEFRRAVGRLPQQDKFRVGKAIELRRKIAH